MAYHSRSSFYYSTCLISRFNKRGTTLKRDGEFYTDTETYSSYVAYEGQHRPELARRPTSLKMEGELDTTTEKCEKFIRWLNVSRPELTRVPTHLKLEGEFETVTENHANYVPFVGVRRPELLRQNTNLKLEGESNFVPEYTDVFRRHDGRGDARKFFNNDLGKGNGTKWPILSIRGCLYGEFWGDLIFYLTRFRHGSNYRL